MEARHILEAYDIRVPIARVAKNIEEAKIVVKETGYPVVLKSTLRIFFINPM